jgi:hypothetical protein
MTANREKGAPVAAQYGVPEHAVYGYDEWDRLVQNPDTKLSIL